MDEKSKDFIFSFVLIALGLFVTLSGVAMYQEAKLPPYSVESFALSPGFMPTILGIALTACSVILLLQSLRGKGSFADAFRDNARQFAAWVKPAFRSKDAFMMGVGILMMFVYSYFLVGLLPYWVASLIFLMALMFFLRAARWWKIILISLAAVGIIIFLFQFCFHAALP